MSGLHPDAQALIDAANRGEAPLPPRPSTGCTARFLYRATLLGAALAFARWMASTLKVGGAKAGLTLHLVSFGVIGAGAAWPPGGEATLGERIDALGWSRSATERSHFEVRRTDRAGR